LATGQTGMAAMQLSRAGVTAKKSWFFINDCLVCLGAGITADASHGPITTSVDQCWVSGQTAIDNVMLSKNKSGAVTGSSPATVINGGFLYRFPSGGSIHVERTTVTAHWRRINLAAAAAAAASGEVFRLWFDHGTGPNGATYAYTVEPIDLAPSLATTAPPTDFPEIFANTETVQAVVNRERTTVQAVFWAAGRIDVHGILRLETDTPAIIQATRTARGVTLTVANPLQDSRALQIKVTPLDASLKATSGTETVALTFAFGEGSSTTTTILIP
jgi:chondroitin AC lyase